MTGEKLNRETKLSELIYAGTTIGDLVDILKKEMEKDHTLKTPALGGDQKEQSIKLRVTYLCQEIGIPAQFNGYKYVRDAILQVYEKPELINAITRELYPRVAKLYNTTPSKVERNIRYAIGVAWKRGNPDTLNKLFGHTISSMRGKPTNSEFIAKLAERLHLPDEN